MGNNGGESKGDTEQFQGTGPNTREGLTLVVDGSRV